MNNCPCGSKCKCFKNNICDCNPINEEIIKIVKTNMLKECEFLDLANFFKIFCDSTRVKILWALKNSEMCVSDLSFLLNMTKSAISHQLKYLKNFNIVTSRREGKIVFYSIKNKNIEYIFEKGYEYIKL